ncbi:MAG: hypothetical protein KJ734_03135 [Chloroflexi bacterium]|nr:hypothetical protein [Chloroflexota bacterium]
MILKRLAIATIVALILALLVWNVLWRGEPDLEHRGFYGATTVGHWAGIVGAVMIVVSQTYSLRKRARRLRWGKQRTWLTMHMALGLIGPLLVEWHCWHDFWGVAGLTRLALWAVVISGVLGAYLYTRIPTTIADDARDTVSLGEERARLVQEMEVHAQARDRIAERLDDVGILDILSGTQRKGVRLGKARDRGWRSFAQMLRFTRAHLADAAATRRALKQQYRAERRALDTLYQRMFARVDLERKTARLLVVDELLAVWHAIHIPLVLLLLFTTALHLFAVFYY